ncbi:amino acid ABC transporter permease [Roseomonas stagni]|uniref:Amino acid ABC transporter permease n=1 Tax=Falsiroseomonas algicola TaxID=2716930 RepID=A0A6M1LU74_9PROT|nr:amino acid ABC transporter permease [Falsiroseomonas algicola]NGM24008.1 amino acid ABC transporter permease [Falsiroseomonas algicola]
MSYQWDFSPVWRNAGPLLEGLGNTLWLSGWSILLGLALGLGLALLRLSPSRIASVAALVVIEFYRNTPPLVHFFWIFFGLPILIGVSMSPFTAALLALSIQSGAFFAEIFRGGIVSIERGQWEAGRALGMSEARLMRRIILPQAVRRMIPPLMERSFELVKTTALAATLAYGELLYRAMVIASQTFRPLEIYTAVAVIFFSVLFLASLGMRRVEHVLRRGHR